MKQNKIKLEWEGDAIKQSVIVPDMKFSPKEIIDSLDNVRGKIDQIKDQKEKLLRNLDSIENDIKSVRSFEADRSQFEEKCKQLCKDKLVQYVASLLPKLTEEAIVEAQKLFDNDPNAYTDQLKINQKYVILQKKLATNEKIAKNIPASMIKEMLFEKPIFDNPFK